jgi:ClpP class serine protease
MKTLFHAMEEKTLARFLETKQELLAVAQTMTAEARQAARAEIMEAAVVYDVSDDCNPRDLYTVNAEGTAVIPVSGKLTAEVDICDGFFSDVTTYGFITAAALAADSDPYVKKIVFRMASGGGTVTGVDNCARVLATLKKPTEGHIVGMCASACYWLASQLDRIVCTSPTDFVGSIGVACELVDFSKQDEARGVKRYVLTSTDAPDKRPDIKTKAGRDKYVEELDALHEIFVRRVATGRGVTADVVDADFGRGGVVIAAKAQAAGMIDAVDDMPPMDEVPPGEEPKEMPENDEEEGTQAPAAAGKTKREVQQMKLSELLAANPAAKAEYDANLAAARAEGETAGKSAVQATINRVAPVLASKEYGDKVKEIAVSALKGDKSIDAFDAAVAAVDAVREERSASAAQEESEAKKETPGQQQKTREPGAVVASQDDLDAEIARMKGGN